MAFVNLSMMVEQNRQPEPSLSGMCDEELATRMVAWMMQQGSDTVVQIAKELGWTMVPLLPLA